MKIGIVREGKTPPDKRVPFTPTQCKEIVAKYPVDLVVQPSSIRSYTDQEYLIQGITLQEDLSDCDVLFGVKEVPIDQLIPGKQYFFFSHTIKKQPYNAKLLRAVLDKKIQLTDYETLTHPEGGRILGFGRYAGIVGAYNGLLAFGKRTQLYDLTPANQLKDYDALKAELLKVKLPSGFKIALTGNGRVGKGAMEIMKVLGIQKVDRLSYLNDTFEAPVCTMLDCMDYYQAIDGSAFDMKHFQKNPTAYKGTFQAYAQVTDFYISCHFWDNNADVLISKEDVQSDSFKIKVIADITCDIQGSIVTTIRPSTIADPIYGVFKNSIEEAMNPFSDDVITVMAVDNLPCELPRDASNDFGSALMEHVLPCLLGEDEGQVIARASITNLKGTLNEGYLYLDAYSKNI